MNALRMWFWLAVGFGTLGGLGFSAHYWPWPTAVVGIALSFWAASRLLLEGQP